jgi:bifunctional enzyme CysN/CysC
VPWYNGPSLLEHLESVALDRVQAPIGFRLPVQWVNRPNQEFRGFSGSIAAGTVAVGDEIVVHPSGKRSQVARIVTADGDLDRAVDGQAITLTLRDEVDISRGDVISAARQPPEVADQFAAHLLWMNDAPLLPGRPYWLKTAARTVAVTITEIKYKVDVNTQEHLAAKRLELKSAIATSTSISRSRLSRTRTIACWADSS